MNRKCNGYYIVLRKLLIFLHPIMTKGKILLLGTNMSDRWSNLIRCKAAIEEQVGKIKRCSAVYETAAWGKTDQAPFLNQVVVVDTLLAPVNLLKTILNIEHQLGRIRKEKWGARIIDIDILYYDSDIISLPGLTIPHPEIRNRRFTLIPLEEIVPGFIDPMYGLTVQELLKRCEDHSQVSKCGHMAKNIGPR